MTAWDLIGFDGHDWSNPDEDGSGPASRVRIKGGRTLYEAVMYLDNTPGTKVKLVRLDTSKGYLREVSRWVDPDTEMEIVPDRA